MKKVLASLFALSMVLAACSNDEDKEPKKDDHAKQEQSTKQDKNDHKEQASSKSKDESTSSDQAKTSKSDANNQNNDQQSEMNNQNTEGKQQQGQQNDQSSGTQANGQASNQQQQDNSQNEQTSQTKSQYVAPYQGENIVPVAQNIAREKVNRQQALQNLPNFQVALDSARQEVGQLNGQQNPYNDFALQGAAGQYSYLFSFINQSQPGTYVIVTVDHTGAAKIIDPAYRQ
ncbi:hypothetical protein [Staphylococcus coagulans]|uniref:hypothetical protein n=1 Tax=Staphylococcus coagulans TaxID=74706 RepID=UPI001BEC5927|nr:hypothetical protein [Staphylococcus coagulans]MBT2819168.1 hypothetical protein [Staphylococcus coagulans]